jgi:hypothetical protein
MWSRAAAIGAGLYLLVFLCAAIYPWFDHRTFSGLAAVLLALPWVDYFPSSLFSVAIFLNAVIIYVVLAVVSRALTLIGLRMKK